MSDPVTKPEHYMLGDGIEVMAIIKAAGWFPEFAKANMVKYTLRAGKKEGVSAKQDIQKAAEYANRLIEWLGEHGDE